MQQLLGGPRSGFTADEVLATLALTAGARVRHGVDVLDNHDTLIHDAVLPVESGEITWAFRPPDDVTGASNEAAEVRATGTITVTGPTSLFIEGFRYRPWTEMLSPGGNWIRFNRGVFIASRPVVEDDGTVVRRKVALADKTVRLKRPLLEPLTVPAATNPVTFITGDMGSRFGETAFDIPATTVVTAGPKTWAADGTTWLQVYNALLEVCAYDQVTVNEDTGRFRSVALTTLAARAPETSYGPGAGKIMVAGTLEPLLPDLVNVVRFAARNGPSLPEEGNGYVTVRNQSTGPASIDRLDGDERVIQVPVDADNQTQLAHLAQVEAQRYFAGGGLRFTGKIGLNPLHADRDVVSLNHPRLGISGDDSWLVTSWTYPMRPMGSQEDAVMAVTFEKKVVVT